MQHVLQRQHDSKVLIHKHSPCNQDIFSIWLRVEAVQQRESNLRFALAVGFQLLRQQANLLCQLIHWFRSLRSGDLDVADQSRYRKSGWRFCSNQSWATLKLMKE